MRWGYDVLKRNGRLGKNSTAGDLEAAEALVGGGEFSQVPSNRRQSSHLKNDPASTLLKSKDIDAWARH